MHIPNLHTTPKGHLITIGTFSTKTIPIQKVITIYILPSILKPSYFLFC